MEGDGEKKKQEDEVAEDESEGDEKKKDGDAEDGEAKAAEEEDGDGKDLTGEEERLEGSVARAVYMDYFKMTGWFHVFIVVLMFALQPLTKIGSTYWLTVWSSDTESEDFSQVFYLVTYCVAAFSTVAISIVRNWFSAYATVQASRNMHT